MCAIYKFCLDRSIGELEKLSVQLSEKYGEKNVSPILAKEVFPKSAAPVVGPGRRASLLVWGFPLHAKSGVVFNARSESLSRKKMFRGCLGNRCLVPATAFYEWGPDKKKYVFSAGDLPFFYMAALWRAFPSAQGGRIFCFTIITTPASDAVAPYHSRMPAIIRPGDADNWLDPKTDAASLLRPYEGRLISAASDF